MKIETDADITVLATNAQILQQVKFSKALSLFFFLKMYNDREWRQWQETTESITKEKGTEK